MFAHMKECTSVDFTWKQLFLSFSLNSIFDENAATKTVAISLKCVYKICSSKFGRWPQAKSTLLCTKISFEVDGMSVKKKNSVQ